MDIRLIWIIFGKTVPPVPKFGDPAAQQALVAGGGGPGGPPGAAPPGGPGGNEAGPGTPPPMPPPPPEAPNSGPTGQGPLDIHGLMGFDEGGWLMPNQPGINTTG
jgi:hypothetical protein